MSLLLRIKQIQEAVEHINELIVTRISHFCIVLSIYIVFSFSNLIIVSPQLCEVVSADIIPTLELRTLRPERPRGLPKPQS